MPRVTRAALIQASNDEPADAPIEKIKQAMIDKHVELIARAASDGARICCMQELFCGPYFPAEQDTRWYEMTERVPDGPTIKLMADLARKHGLILVVSVYEVDMTGVFYNTAALIDEQGNYLGKYRKQHIPHCYPGFWEKFYFKPGDLGYPVWETSAGRIGVYICYDRHFPEGARELGLNGAEIVFNPSATVAGLSEHLWKLEQPAHAVANQYFVGAINRVGTEGPWNIGEFYGTSYFCDPRGQIMVEGPRDKDAVIVADLDLDLIQEVRNVWQFFRDRRPESYDKIALVSSTG
jgi:N-carbamoylputrescine amidase